MIEGNFEGRERKDEHVKGIRDRSGHVKSDDKLVSFLYQLMRDHVTPGIIEEIMFESDYQGETLYTNGWLANYSKDLADRLRS